MPQHFNILSTFCLPSTKEARQSDFFLFSLLLGSQAHISEVGYNCWPLWASLSFQKADNCRDPCRRSLRMVLRSPYGRSPYESH